MRYINLLFTYLLTYLLKTLGTLGEYSVRYWLRYLPSTRLANYTDSTTPKVHLTMSAACRINSHYFRCDIVQLLRRYVSVIAKQCAGQFSP